MFNHLLDFAAIDLVHQHGGWIHIYTPYDVSCNDFIAVGLRLGEAEFINEVAVIPFALGRMKFLIFTLIAAIVYSISIVHMHLLMPCTGEEACA